MINIIVAHDENRVIGDEEIIPWIIPEDLKLFKKLTNNHTVIMGRKTWGSLPIRPLPNRKNIVVSSTISGNNDFAVCKSLEEAIGHAYKYNPNTEIFIIGGESIYKEALDKDYVDRLFISHIPGKHEGNVLFPELDNRWINVITEIYKGFIFRTYQRERG